MDASSLFLTANCDTIYVISILNLGDGPQVLEAPPKALGTIDDMWFQWVIDVGLPGPDRGAGGKYLIVPPGYSGVLPESGYQDPDDSRQGLVYHPAPLQPAAAFLRQVLAPERNRRNDLTFPGTPRGLRARRRAQSASAGRSPVVAHLSPRRPGFTGSHPLPTDLSRPSRKRQVAVMTVQVGAALGFWSFAGQVRLPAPAPATRD